MMEPFFNPPPWKQQKNEQAVTIYAVFLIGLIMFTILARHVFAYLSNRQSRARFSRPYLLLFKILSKRTPWKWLGQPSWGVASLVGMYAMGNIILSQTVLATHWINHYASRCGWLTAANMALCVFLGVKNTPLSLVTNISHVELNVLHRIVGYTACALLSCHVMLYTIHDGIQHRLETLLEPHNLAGMGAGVAMIVLLMGIFRDRHYRLFYTSHVVGFIAALVLAGLHRPNWAKKLPLVMLLTASMWLLDRGIRTAKTVYRLVSNQVTLHPLPDGGVRLLVKKPSGTEILPGQHCFLWIPQLRLFQTHPFTVVSKGPEGIEFLVKSYKGFTKQLYDLADASPGVVISRASLDGPYGSLPPTSNYDRVVLIAGGSGGAFTFGLMNRIMNHSGRVALQTIDFVWAVKRAENLLWFHEHLTTAAEIRSAVKMQLYVTREPPHSWQDEARAVVNPKTKISVHDAIKSCSSRDMLVGASYMGQIRWEKMDVEAVVTDALHMVEAHQRVLVATCGPRTLTNAVKNAVERLWKQRELQVDVHSEEFST